MIMDEWSPSQEDDFVAAALKLQTVKYDTVRPTARCRRTFPTSEPMRHRTSVHHAWMYAYTEHSECLPVSERQTDAS